MRPPGVSLSRPRRFPDGRFGATGSRTSVSLLSASNAFGGLVVLDTGPRGLTVFSATQTNKHMSIPFVRQAPPEAVGLRERCSEVLPTFAGYEGLRPGRASISMRSGNALHLRLLHSSILWVVRNRLTVTSSSASSGRRGRTDAFFNRRPTGDGSETQADEHPMESLKDGSEVAGERSSTT